MAPPIHGIGINFGPTLITCASPLAQPHDVSVIDNEKPVQPDKTIIDLCEVKGNADYCFLYSWLRNGNISSYDSQRAIWLDVGPTGSPFNEQALAVFFKPIIHDVHEATKKSLYDLSHGTVNDCTIMGISIPDYWPKIVRDVILDAIESKCGAFPLTEKTSGQASFVAYNFGPCLAKQKPWLMLVIEVNQDVTVLEIVDVGGHENMKEKSWAIGNGDALLGKDKDSYITQLKQGLLPLTKACRTRLELKAVILTGELEPSRVPELHSELLTIFHDVPVNDFGPVYTQVSPRYVGAWGAARAFRIAINKQLDSNDSLALDIVTPLIIQ